MAQRDFQRLVKLVARLFYAEGVPPPEDPLQDEDEEFYKPRKKAPAGPCLGLGVVVLDALTRREWVQEDYVPRLFVQGEVRDMKPPGLAQQLRLQPKLLRQTLRYFESELLVRREHRQEKATRRKRRGDLLPDAAAQSMLAGQDAMVVTEDGDGAPKQHTHSYCCIDYPSFVDVVQLKLFLMRAELKGAVEDADPVAGYACRACGAAYTSMDAVRLVDHSGDFLCEECGCCLSHGCAQQSRCFVLNQLHVTFRQAVEQQFEGGQMGGEEERRARKAAARALLASFERATKPVRELLERLKNVAPPDYGPLQDWQVAKQQAAALKQRKASKGGQRDMATLNVELDLTAGSAAVEEIAAKAQPAWMQRDGIASQGNGSTPGDAEAAAEAARDAEEQKRRELAYAQAWMAKMAEAEADRERAAAEAPPSDGASAPGAKRPRTQGGWSHLDDPAVKQEQFQVKPEVKPEPKADMSQPGTAIVTAPLEGNHDADWEDVDTANAGAGSDDEGALEWESD